MFLLADISMDIMLRITFFILSNIKIDLVDWHLHWKTYTTTKILPRMCWVELIGKKVFATINLDLKNKVL